jgi:hypothetical protein
MIETTVLSTNPTRLLLASLCEQFAALPQVEAVALGGSRGRDAAGADACSGIDLYVYTRDDIALPVRQAIVERCGGASRADLGMTYWGAGDEWLAAGSGIEVDVVFFDTAWMQESIARVIDRHQASIGYTTCFWHTVRHSLPLHDQSAWFADLQARCAIDYPRALRRNIVNLNHPLLRGVIPAYANQIAKAVARRDLVSLNHRLAALLASYFDCLFAANGLLHPGEKRLLELAADRCTFVPEQMVADVGAVLHAAAADIASVPQRLSGLLDRLDSALLASGLDLPAGRPSIQHPATSGHREADASAGAATPPTAGDLCR